MFSKSPLHFVLFQTPQFYSFQLPPAPLKLTAQDQSFISTLENKH